MSHTTTLAADLFSSTFPNPQNASKQLYLDEWTNLFGNVYTNSHDAITNTLEGWSYIGIRYELDNGYQVDAIGIVNARFTTSQSGVVFTDIYAVERPSEIIVRDSEGNDVQTYNALFNDTAHTYTDAFFSEATIERIARRSTEVLVELLQREDTLARLGEYVNNSLESIRQAQDVLISMK